MEKEQTFYQELKAKGYTRRQFLKFCGIMGAMLGLHQTGIAQVVNALQTKPRKPVLWFHFQECTCCSESFLRSSHPLVGQILLEMISLDYSDTLMAASGFQAEEVRTRSMKENWGKYIMIVEGSIPLGNPGYCTIAGHSTGIRRGCPRSECYYRMGKLRVLRLHTRSLPEPDRYETRT